jgi:predicted Ser/Thr protein kinase
MVPEDLPFQFIRDITDDFAEERILGEGGFGVVYKVRFRHPHKNCVVFQNNMVLLYQRGQKPSNFRMW